MSSVCPYCERPVGERSLDHVFPDFLGGRRKIVACAKCNNTFGHTFEAAAAADTLHPLHVSIASWGLPLRKRERAWRRAFEFRGMQLDVTVTDEGVKLRLSGPVPQAGADGKPASVLYADRRDAEKAARQVEKKKGGRVSVEKVLVEITPFHMPFNFLVDSNLGRTALKMCAALSTFLPGFSLSEITEARPVLRGERPWEECVTIAFKSYDSLEALRPPLSHVIYVERHQGRLHGVIQFFGVIQLYCRLGASTGSAPEAGMLGTLDPITGAEEILPVTPLGLSPPPDPYKLPELFSRGSGVWLMKFEESARERGASETVNLTGTAQVGGLTG